mmetsp:Transcript_97676/g.168400  ORF Transcript_97676/g.168400 Transcript_97676/m.168400 type:complete len:529 (-) Transcript_97676:985-2571(-)
MPDWTGAQRPPDTTHGAYSIFLGKVNNPIPCPHLHPRQRSLQASGKGVGKSSMKGGRGKGKGKATGRLKEVPSLPPTCAAATTAAQALNAILGSVPSGATVPLGVLAKVIITQYPGGWIQHFSSLGTMQQFIEANPQHFKVTYSGAHCLVSRANKEKTIGKPAAEAAPKKRVEADYLLDMGEAMLYLLHTAIPPEGITVAHLGSRQSLDGGWRHNPKYKIPPTKAIGEFLRQHPEWFCVEDSRTSDLGMSVVRRANADVAPEAPEGFLSTDDTPRAPSLAENAQKSMESNRRSGRRSRTHVDTRLMGLVEVDPLELESLREAALQQMYHNIPPEGIRIAQLGDFVPNGGWRRNPQYSQLARNLREFLMQHPDWFTVHAPESSDLGLCLVQRVPRPAREHTSATGVRAMATTTAQAKAARPALRSDALATSVELESVRQQALQTLYDAVPPGEGINIAQLGSCVPEGGWRRHPKYSLLAKNMREFLLQHPDWFCMDAPFSADMGKVRRAEAHHRSPWSEDASGTGTHGA